MSENPVPLTWDEIEQLILALQNWEYKGDTSLEPLIAKLRQYQRR